jgi:hypothetical protein
MKITYGGFGGVDTRRVDELFIKEVATAQYSRMNKMFHMPHMRNPADIFELRLVITDAIYTVSYRRHGQITDWYFEEAVKAVVAYLSQFLSPRLEFRKSFLEAVSRGEPFQYPIEVESDDALKCVLTSDYVSSSSV